MDQKPKSKEESPIYLCSSQKHGKNAENHMSNSQNKNKDMQLMYCFKR